MTPQDLTALYAAFFINWSLIWLTNLSETVVQVEDETITPKPTEDSDEFHPRHTEERYYITSRRHRKRRQLDAELAPASHTWNVSNFFGLKQISM